MGLEVGVVDELGGVEKEEEFGLSLRWCPIAACPLTESGHELRGRGLWVNNVKST